MQELGDRYVQAQVDHHEILRAAFKSSDGRELRTEGDSFFCVFESALDACGAAAEAQRAFADACVARRQADPRSHRPAHGRGPAGGQRVHRPRRAPRGADRGGGARRPGPAVGGHPARWSRPSLPSGLDPARPRHCTACKDLARPERLYQLVIDGVPDTFPALRTLDSTPNNLPTQLTSFVGREELVVEAKRLLDGHAPADADRPRRHRQDAPQPPDRGRGRASVSRRRLLRGPRRRCATPS